MKKIITICCVGLLLIFGLGQAHAATEKGPRLLFAQTQERTWSEMQGWIMTNGWGNRTGISRSGIIRMAFTDAKNKNLLGLMVPGKRNEQAYGEAFMRANGLVNRDGSLVNRMSYKDFRTQGQQKGFFAPVMSTAERTQQLTAQIASLQGQVSDGQAALATEMQENEVVIADLAARLLAVNELAKANDGSVANVKAVADEAKADLQAVWISLSEGNKVTEANSKLLRELSTGWNDFASNGVLPEAVIVSIDARLAGQIAPLESKISSLEASMQVAATERGEIRDSVTALDQRVTNEVSNLRTETVESITKVNQSLETGLSNLDQKLNTNAAATDSKLRYTWIGSGVALLLLLGVIIGVVRFGNRKIASVKTELGEEISRTNAVASEALSVSSTALKTEMKKVVFSTRSPTLDDIQDSPLPVAQDSQNPVLISCTYNKQEYAIEVWREMGDPDEMVRIDCARNDNPNCELLVGIIACKNIEDVIRKAVVTGRANLAQESVALKVA